MIVNLLVLVLFGTMANASDVLYTQEDALWLNKTIYCWQCTNFVSGMFTESGVSFSFVNPLLVISVKKDLAIKELEYTYMTEDSMVVHSHTLAFDLTPVHSKPIAGDWPLFFINGRKVDMVTQLLYILLTWVLVAVMVMIKSAFFV